jgi:hypothetical protein
VPYVSLSLILPAGPPPMIATLLPVLSLGGLGTIHPSSHALSMMEASMVLMDTGFSMMPRTQEPSHGAGQTRPVNSGKLLVSKSLSRASLHLPAGDREDIVRSESRDHQRVRVIRKRERDARGRSDEGFPPSPHPDGRAH